MKYQVIQRQLPTAKRKGSILDIELFDDEAIARARAAELRDFFPGRAISLRRVGRLIPFTLREAAPR